MPSRLPVKDALRARLAQSGAMEELHSPHDPPSMDAAPDNFTLMNFFINKKNALPLDIARETARQPAEIRYNPLLYYGKNGSGKTHLLRAIARECGKSRSEQDVFYGTPHQWHKACQMHAGAFRVERCQIYCIDDMQHIFVKDSPLQEHFCAFLDACLHEKKQIVCACSGSPASHKGLSDNLRCRLEHGLMLEIKNPDLDVRMRFLQAQCALYDLHISREHLLFLAQRCENLCNLSKVILRIRTFGKPMQDAITTHALEKILQQSGDQQFITPQRIIRQVAEYFALPQQELTGTTRKHAVVFARQIAIYLCRELLGASYPALGRIFGGKDHSTIMYSVKKVEQYEFTHTIAHTQVTELKNVCVQERILPAPFAMSGECTKNV